MKRVYIATALTCLLVAAVFGAVYTVWEGAEPRETLKVGFIYKYDESTPYTYNFMQAQETLERELSGRVQTLSHRNVPEEDTLEPLHDLVRQGCAIIFTNNNSVKLAEAAREYPEVQFCQGAFADVGDVSDVPNYHSFGAAIYQGRYVSGIAAGLKLKEMIDAGQIKPEQALVGYVGSSAIPDVISGYTAFLLGIRSVVPEATMRVRYTGAWNNYNRERSCARALIDEGCVVISHHTDTIGPATACEEVAASKNVIHVGYHMGMTDIAPRTSLISTRTNWDVYVVNAVRALLEGKEIERFVPGQAFGHDMCGGFDYNWVEMTELNRQLAAPGTQEKLDAAIDALRRGAVDVFRGDYTGADPVNPDDRIDLSQGYRENARCSWPTFHYVLDGVVVVEDN